MNKQRGNRSRTAGFTLIEILVVVLIIGLLVGLVGPNVFIILFKGQIGAARIQLEDFEAAISLYKVNHGRTPDSLAVLTELDEETGEPYMNSIPFDPWKHPYEFVVNPDGSYDILSYGADGMEGGEGENADISLIEVNMPG